MKPARDGSVFVHSQGLCESKSVGAGTRVWAFTHILPGAQIGEDCNICESVFIEDDVIVGDRVTIKNGVQLWNGVRIANDVFIGPNVTFTNDPFPRSRAWKVPIETSVGHSASIGANATILPGVKIGTGAMIGAGSVVTRDVPPNSKVTGNPARIYGYVTSGPGSTPASKPGDSADEPTLPGQAKLLKLPEVLDMRGNLSALEFQTDLPFIPQRFFAVYSVPSVEVRGEHAHKACHQMLFALSGSVKALIDDGRSRAEVILRHPSTALYLPPLVWSTQFHYSADAVLGVFASLPYDSDDYIREYEEFLNLIRP